MGLELRVSFLETVVNNLIKNNRMSNQDKNKNKNSDPDQNDQDPKGQDPNKSDQKDPTLQVPPGEPIIREKMLRYKGITVRMDGKLYNLTREGVNNDDTFFSFIEKNHPEN